MIKQNDILQFDNIIPVNTQNLLQEYLEGTFGATWHIKKNLSQNTESEKEDYFHYTDAPGFTTVFKNKYINDQYLYDISKSIVFEACKKINFTPNDITLGRSFYQMPLTTHNGLGIPHVDNNIKHLVVLYYVIDGDGDTVWFDERYNETSSRKKEDFNIIKRVSPKKGRVAIFDGFTYHSNYLPQKNNRCVINFNVI